MKNIIILVLFLLPITALSQEVGLEENSKSKRTKQLKMFNPLQNGDVISTFALGGVERGSGLNINIKLEYMLNDKLGVRFNLLTNNLFYLTNNYGINRFSLELGYHFIQQKRWDIFCFAGLGVNSVKYLSNRPDNPRINQLVSNAGVGARYKLAPTFGFELELGKMYSFGVFKKFRLHKSVALK